MSGILSLLMAVILGAGLGAAGLYYQGMKPEEDKAAQQIAALTASAQTIKTQSAVDLTAAKDKAAEEVAAARQQASHDLDEAKSVMQGKLEAAKRDLEQEKQNSATLTKAIEDLKKSAEPSSQAVTSTDSMVPAPSTQTAPVVDPKVAIRKQLSDAQTELAGVKKQRKEWDAHSNISRADSEDTRWRVKKYGQSQNVPTEISNQTISDIQAEIDNLQAKL